MKFVLLSCQTPQTEHDWLIAMAEFLAKVLVLCRDLHEAEESSVYDIVNVSN